MNNNIKFRKKFKNLVRVICVNLWTVIFLVGFLTPTQGQQYDPLYTQYMFNSLSLNPGYAGTSGLLSAMLLSRHQWVGFDNAPNTQTFSIHSPIASTNTGLGFSMIYDHLGPIVNTNFSLDYAFRFRISENVKMSLGLKGAIAYFQRDLSQFFNEVGNDHVYYEKIDPKVLPNFGFGVYCYGDKFYAGASIPRLIENTISDDGAESLFTKKENRMYMLMSGAVIDAGSTFKFKPSFLLRLSNTAPVSIDLNVNMLISEMVWVGAMFRPKEAYGALLQVQVTNQFRVGYAFEMNYNIMMSHHKGTHEIMLNFDFIFRKENIQNPRYF